MNCSTPGFPVLHYLLSLLRLMSIELVIPSNHLILCCPLPLLSSIFPNIRVFSNELDFHIRWPKYQSFSFSINPSNEYSGLISLRIDWFDLLAVHGTLKTSPAPQFESINSSALGLLYSIICFENQLLIQSYSQSHKDFNNQNILFLFPSFTFYFFNYESITEHCIS